MKQWHCPNCTEAARTFDDAIPMHRCRSGTGILLPLIVDGTKAKIQIVEREDYVGKELVPRDINDRPVMSVVTTRDDGQDCIIFPATATAVSEE